MTKSPGWDRSFRELDTRGHYLDAFLADLKRESYLALIQRWGGVPLDGRVLKTDLFEEAMGPDAFLLELGKSPGLLIGMDLSSEGVVRAKSHDAKTRARYVMCDARQLPFADGSLDLIVSPSTLDHFTDTADLGRSLHEIRRALAPDGRLIITLDNRQNVSDPLLRLAKRFDMIPFFLGRSYTVGELRRELDAAGLEVIETTALVHHPRLAGVAASSLARRVHWTPATRWLRSAFIAMQRMQDSRLQYFSGCFVAALAKPRA
jgi:SAM-dependent methyltransferase